MGFTRHDRTIDRIQTRGDVLATDRARSVAESVVRMAVT